MEPNSNSGHSGSSINARLHVPQRLEGETRQQYSERRKASKAAVERILRGTYLKLRDLGGKGPSSTDRERAAARARIVRTEPKFSKQRKHKQTTPIRRDGHGSFTWTGRTLVDGKPGRRIWLAGISAQRGY